MRFIHPSPAHAENLDVRELEVALQAVHIGRAVRRFLPRVAYRDA